jgi:uncharacterized protein YjgD (DUF1641 family)
MNLQKLLRLKLTLDNMQYPELKQKIVQWGEDRNIFEFSTPIKQLHKTQEELNETMQALVQFADAKTDKAKQDALEEVIDGIGDMGVTLLMLCHKMDVDFVECLASAYDVIKDRKGKMINGLFVKEA